MKVMESDSSLNRKIKSRENIGLTKIGYATGIH
jgi:hypothetical protein